MGKQSIERLSSTRIFGESRLFAFNKMGLGKNLILSAVKGKFEKPWAFCYGNIYIKPIKVVGYFKNSLSLHKKTMLC